MRLSELHLDRYGAFTGTRLVFPPDRPLVVVHGANEAGKSTALAALVDALFGIEARSRFDFLHDYAAMRVGATLSAADGATLAFRRRKGNRATLLDPEERPLPDDALARFLGRVDRALFLDAFALDQERLRAGATRLAEGRGALGEALLAAAPGLGRLVELRRTVSDKAAALFTERRDARKPFYRALDDWTAARQRTREASLSADTLAKAAAQRDDTRRAVERIDAERRGLRAEEARLGRLRRALPRLAAIDGLCCEIAAQPVPVTLDLALAAAVDDALTRLARAEDALGIHRPEREPLVAERAGLGEAEPILAEAATIDRIAEGRRSRTAALTELDDARARAAEAGVRLQDLARRLGLIDADALEERRPTAAALARVRALLGERRTRDAAAAAAAEALAEAEARLERLRADRAAAIETADPAAARAAFDALAGLPAAQRLADARRSQGEQAERRLQDAVARTDLSGWSIEAIRTRPLPDRADVERAAEDIAAARAACEAAAQRRRELDDRRKAAERRLADLAAGDPPATDESVRAARRSRDDAFAVLRAILFGGADPGPVQRSEAVRTFERLAVEADALADRRVRDADRIAAVDAGARALRDAEADEAAAETALAEAGAARDRAEAAWLARLAGHGLEAKPPAEVLRLIEARAEILRLGEAADMAGAEAAVAADDLARQERALAALAASLGLPADAEWTLAMARVRQAIEAIEAARAAVRDREAAIVEAEARTVTARSRLRAVSDGAAAAVAGWQDALATLGLSGDPHPVEVEAALGVWSDCAEPLAMLRDARDRGQRLTDQVERFDAEVRSLAARIAPDLPGSLDPVDLSGRMADRLAEARARDLRRRQLDERIHGLTERISACESARSAASATLARLTADAGLEPDADLRSLLESARRVHDLTQRRDAERRALLDESGQSEESLRQALAGEDPDLLAARSAEIAERLAALDREHEEAVAARTTAAAAFDALANRDGAELHAQAEQNALARIAETAEDWRVLQTAGRMLAAVVEEFRRRHQNPVLDEAGRLFATLTAGRYPALSPDFDENGDARLVALRDDGRRLQVGALSEGTRDQLFLALRLATLADHATRAEPLPFVGDDLFVTFDERRTAAGLAALADFADRTGQAILFTHHEHVAHLAETTLPGRAAVLRLAGV